MRLDLFLKASRVCPRRSVAQDLCDAGLVTINGKRVKPAHVVKIGDEITINSRSRLIGGTVEAVPASRNTSKSDAAKLFRIIRDEKILDNYE